MSNDNGPIVMAEGFWANSQLSVARHTGSIRAFGNIYTICDKYGRTVFETSIHPGEPADLVAERFIPYYRKLGRDRFLEVIERNPNETKKKLHEIFQDLIKKKPIQDNSKQTALEL